MDDLRRRLNEEHTRHISHHDHRQGTGTGPTGDGNASSGRPAYIRVAGASRRLLILPVLRWICFTSRQNEHQP